MEFPEMFEEEEPRKQEAPEEPDDSDAGLDDTAPFQYHRQSRGLSRQYYSTVYAAGPTKQVRPFLGLALGTPDWQCPLISPYIRMCCAGTDAAHRQSHRSPG